MSETVPFPICEFEKRISKYNFVKKLKNPSKKTIASLIKKDKYMSDFNFSDIIVGYYKLPVELFYIDMPQFNRTKSQKQKQWYDIYLLCTKKNKNSKDIA
jgi:hypothetical protein